MASVINDLRKITQGKDLAGYKHIISYAISYEKVDGEIKDIKSVVAPVYVL